jgi:hypothetical protein
MEKNILILKKVEILLDDLHFGATLHHLLPGMFFPR